MLPLLFDQAQQLADYARGALQQLGAKSTNKVEAGPAEHADQQRARFAEDASTLRLSGARRAIANGEDADNALAAEGRRRSSASLQGALSAATAQLRRDAVGAFGALGMERGLAERAGKALAEAAREATRGADFAAQISSLTATEETRVGGNGFYYGASMALRQVELSYDAERGSFSATVIEVSISLEVASGSMIERLDPLVLDLAGREADLRQATSGLFLAPDGPRPSPEARDPSAEMSALLLLDAAERAENTAETAEQESAGDASTDGAAAWPARLRLDAVVPLLLPRESVASAPAVAPVDLRA